jgi:hypothetical protein
VKHISRGPPKEYGKKKTGHNQKDIVEVSCSSKSICFRQILKSFAITIHPLTHYDDIPQPMATQSIYNSTKWIG